MDGLVRFRTDNNLYGPSRISAGTQIKDLLLRDHVLQKGEWHQDTKRLNPWNTTFAHSFKSPSVPRHDTSKVTQPAGRQKAAFVLGTESDTMLTTLSKDFDRKWLKTPKKAQPDMGTSIPDFAQKYMSNKHFGKDGSIYANSFHDVKRADTSQNTKERKQYTSDLRTTHFQLGTSTNGYDSETTHRFNASDVVLETTPLTSVEAARATRRSSVFREGDWNEKGRPCVTNSVTRHDFHVKPFTTGRPTRRHFLARLPKYNDDNQDMSLSDVIREAILTKNTNEQSSLRQEFAEHDQERCGYINRAAIKCVLAKYRPSITNTELESLILECNPGQRGDRLDYGAFALYLTGFLRPKVVEPPVPIIHAESYTGTHYMKTSYPNPDTSQPKDNPHHPHYHVSTHFELGDVTDDPKSVYYKDFMMGAKDPRSKPRPADPPMSSQVLPSVQERTINRSTKTADYADPMARGGRDMARVRDVEARRNQNRLSTQSVAITCDPRDGEGYRQASVSGADYPSPPGDFPTLSPRRAPQSRYRYLDTEGALLHPPRGPPRTEIQDQFIPLDSQRDKREKTTECRERITDNRSSHFALGTDAEPRGSEQHHQFAKIAPFDPKLPAAGKTEEKTNTYSHVYPSESADHSHRGPVEAPKDEAALIQARLREMNNMSQAEQEYIGQLVQQRTDPRIVSVMKNDYCPPEQRSFTSAQQRTIEIARAKPVVTMEPHYFHLAATTKGDDKRTTTRHDFSRPDRLPGKSPNE